MKLIANKIEKSYKSKKVVKGISVEVNQGEIVGLLGPNGAGKTTSFYMIVGLIKPNSGKIFLNNIDVTKYPMYKRAQNGIGYLAQEASIFRKLSVENNILSVLQLTKLSKVQQLKKMDELIDEFGLSHIRRNRGDLLSGGERRRTEIARALATDPKFLLLDEPFAGVDPVAVEDIQKIIAHLKNKNIGILITDHNVQETLAITDKTFLMFEGSILKMGSPEELASDKMVRKVYLGQNFELRKKKIDSLENNYKLLNKQFKDEIYFSLNDNQDALAYFNYIDVDSLVSYIRDELYEKNFNKNSDNFVPVSNVKNKYLINKVKILNHKWIIADFSNGSRWGEMWIEYKLNGNEVTFDIKDYFLY